MLISEKIMTAKLDIKPNIRKTFVFDLDGTIVYDGKPLEGKFEKILLEIKSAGHNIVFATGRSWRDFVPVVPLWCSEQDSVVFGGGLVIANGEIKTQHFLENSVLSEMVEFLEDNHAHYLVDGHSNYYHPSKEHWLYQDIIKISGQTRSSHVDHVLADGAYKILVLDDQFLEYFNQFIANHDLTIKYHFYDKCFDVMPAHVNKFAGLSELILPEKNDIFVFGNDHNDLELMQELPNSIMFGHHQELQKYAKIKIDYDDDLFENFTTVINTILGK